MMKKNICFISFITLLVLMGGCKKSDDGGGKLSGSVWDTPHVDFLALKGPVNRVKDVVEQESEMFTRLNAVFNAKGMLTHYNPTGIDPVDQGGVAAYSLGVSMIYCDYVYDNAGRMSAAIVYEVGAEPIRYDITYGTHKSYVPVPFPVGGMSPFFICGITKISANNGYLMTCDGVGAKSAVELNWVGKTTQIFLFKDGYLSVVELEQFARGEVQSRIKTEYKWGASGELKSSVMLTKLADATQQEYTSLVIEYDPELLYRPLTQSVFVGTQTHASSVMRYIYNRAGELLKSQYTIGSGFDDEFENLLGEEDSHGNWRVRKESSFGDEFEYKREIVYY